MMVRGARNMASSPGATFLFIRAMSSRAFGKPRFARAIRFQFLAFNCVADFGGDRSGATSPD